jgi:hypothetical protein
MPRALATNRRRITRTPHYQNIEDRDFRIWRDRYGARIHILFAYQIAIVTSATTMALHTTGVTCFELPLRGESLAA